MEKRVNRNKELYAQIEKEIAAINKGNDNSDFNSTTQTLNTINPHLFGGANSTNVESKPNETKSTNSNKKRYLITIAVFAVLLIIIIVLAVKFL